MENSYESIIIGASYTGLGFAAANHDCLLLEESELLGGEYAKCFRHSDNSLKNPNTPEGKDFLDFISQYGIVSDDGKTDTLALSTVVNEYANKNSLPILLRTRIISVEYNKGRFTVTAVTNSGIRTFFSSNIIDTSPVPVCGKSTARITKQQFNVLCHNLPEDSLTRLQKEFPGCKLFEGFKDTYFICFPFPTDTDIISARDKVVKAWQRTFKAGEALIDAMGCDMERTADLLKSENHLLRIPETLYNNPVDEFDAGAAVDLGRYAQ